MDDHSTLCAYRGALYHCFTRARDALFEVSDALVIHSSACGLSSCRRHRAGGGAGPAGTRR